MEDFKEVKSIGCDSDDRGQAAPTVEVTNSESDSCCLTHLAMAFFCLAALQSQIQGPALSLKCDFMARCVISATLEHMTVRF